MYEYLINYSNPKTECRMYFSGGVPPSIEDPTPTLPKDPKDPKDPKVPSTIPPSDPKFPINPPILGKEPISEPIKDPKVASFFSSISGQRIDLVATEQAETDQLALYENVYGAIYERPLDMGQVVAMRYKNEIYLVTPDEKGKLHII